MLSMIRKMLIAAVMVCGMTISTGKASAAGLPPASAPTECTSNNPALVTIDAPLACSYQGASASITESPTPMLLSMINDGAYVATQDAFANFYYSFEVVGGQSGDVVPVLINTALSAMGGSTTGGLASITDGTDSIMVCNYNPCTQTSYQGALSLAATVGTAFEIHLQTAAETGYFSGGDVTATASSYIEVDPSFANANSYQIKVSDGVGNAPLVAAVPELSTWAMMTGGFGLIGAAWRRQRRTIMVAG